MPKCLSTCYVYVVELSLLLKATLSYRNSAVWLKLTLENNESIKLHFLMGFKRNSDIIDINHSAVGVDVDLPIIHLINASHNCRYSACAIVRVVRLDTPRTNNK